MKDNMAIGTYSYLNLLEFGTSSQNQLAMSGVTLYSYILLYDYLFF